MDPHARWAEPALMDIFNQYHTTRLRHRIWLHVLRTQIEHGITDDPDGNTLNAYRRVFATYDTSGAFRSIYHARIADLEQTTRHDLKAEVEAIEHFAGRPGRLHLGMTSSDVVDSVWQEQIYQAGVMTRDRVNDVLALLADRIDDFAGTRIVGRTHGQPAQLTTIGKRLADHAQDLLLARQGLARINSASVNRGIRGAIGTNSDQAQLAHSMGLDPVQTAAYLHDLSHPGLHGTGLESVSQGYPRSLDLRVAQGCAAVTAALSALATTVRLMATLGQVTESAEPGQVGSSAMPHKHNPRYCERVCGLHHVVSGYQAMLAGSAGSQWLEGDVAHSSVRRVAIPGVLAATSGALVSMAYVLNRFSVDMEVVGFEGHAHQLQLASGALLAQAVANGANREQAHQRIAEHLQLPLHDAVVGLVADPDLGFTDTNQIRSLIHNANSGAASGDARSMRSRLLIDQGGTTERPRWTPDVV